MRYPQPDGPTLTPAFSPSPAPLGDRTQTRTPTSWVRPCKRTQRFPTPSHSTPRGWSKPPLHPSPTLTATSCPNGRNQLRAGKITTSSMFWRSSWSSRRCARLERRGGRDWIAGREISRLVSVGVYSSRVFGSGWMWDDWGRQLASPLRSKNPLWMTRVRCRGRIACRREGLGSLLKRLPC